MSNQKTESEEKIKSENQNKANEEDKKEKTFFAFYGSKLFVKCFGWFILITLVNTILISVYGYYYHFKPAREEFERIAEKILQNNGQLMVENYEKYGTLKNAKFRGPGNLWVYNEKLELLFDGMKNNEMEVGPLAEDRHRPEPVPRPRPMPFPKDTPRPEPMPRTGLLPLPEESDLKDGQLHKRCSGQNN